MKAITIACLLGLSSLATAEVFLEERFNDGAKWEKRWTPSTYRVDLGQFKLTPGKWFADEEESTGIQTSEDYRFYALSAPLKKTFNNKDKDFVAQFNVKHEQHLDCGGGYVKLFPKKFEAKSFNGDSEYNIMFGPDICGSKSVVHVILNYKGKNYELKRTIPAKNDELTHVYTLIIKPDQTYQVLIDGTEAATGDLLVDWDFLPPKTIPDPDAKKPEDWVDDAKIPDPEDKKPEGYDDIPEFIPDPEAKKPEDWDDDMDGDWEAPAIPNPDYAGPWAPKMIDNPAYKGEWVHPLIDNPEYKVDENIYNYETANLGIDIWQVKSGSIFDNFLVTDDVDYAAKVREETWNALKEKETTAKEAYDEEQKKQAEEAQKILDAEKEKETASEDVKEDEELEGTTPADETTPAEPEVVKDEL